MIEFCTDVVSTGRDTCDGRLVNLEIDEFDLIGIEIAQPFFSDEIIIIVKDIIRTEEYTGVRMSGWGMSIIGGLNRQIDPVSRNGERVVGGFVGQVGFIRRVMPMFDRDFGVVEVIIIVVLIRFFHLMSSVQTRDEKVSSGWDAGNARSVHKKVDKLDIAYIHWPQRLFRD